MALCHLGSRNQPLYAWAFGPSYWFACNVARYGALVVPALGAARHLCIGKMGAAFDCAGLLSQGLAWPLRRNMSDSESGTMKFFDLRHPFFLPLWRRIAAVGIAIGWLVLELVAGSPGWAALCAIVAVYFAYAFFIAFDPAEYKDRRP